MLESCNFLSRLGSKKRILAARGTERYWLQHESRTQIRLKASQIDYETISSLKQQQIIRTLGVDTDLLCNMVIGLVLLALNWLAEG